MNRKRRKQLFIRSKNALIAKGFKAPKWILVNHKWPTKWKNTSPGLFEETWLFDMLQR
jgi:hypothetical protein